MSSFSLCAIHLTNLALRGALRFPLAFQIFQRRDISSSGLILINIVTKGHFIA